MDQLVAQAAFDQRMRDFPMINAQCRICQSGSEIDLSVSNTENARHFGVSESSVRRHKKHSSTLTVPAGPSDKFLESLGIPEAIVTSRSISAKDENGHWNKATWQPNAAVMVEVSSYDDLERSIADYKSDTFYGETQGHTLVLNAADLQIGKAHQRGGGTPQTIERSMNSFHRFLDRVKRERPDHIILADNGDPIENVWNTPTQLVTNDLDVPAQIRAFRRLMIEGIKLLANEAPMFTYLAVPSNHGAARVGYKTPGGTVDADFGLEISYQLEDVCKDHPDLDHVEFVRPEEMYETAVIDASGTRLAFHHGHQSSSSITHSKWWEGQDHGRMPGWDADILVVAHYHTFGIEQSGSGRWIVKVSSSEPSSDYFADARGKRSKRGMTAFGVRDGQWFNPEIL